MPENEVNEYRIFGCPGTGKTTAMTKQIARAARAFGGENVAVCSFTKAAAQELSGRDLPIPEENVSTLHSHAFRAIGRPEVLESSKNIGKWNEWISRRVEDYIVTSNAPNPDDQYGEGMSGKTLGDELLSRNNVCRAQMLHETQISQDVLSFRRYWEDFKKESGMIDFTDMISKAYDEVEQWPGNPQIVFGDEAQDFTLLELSLLRKWGKHLRTLVLAGDDDQCIYAFKGAKPDAFLSPEIDVEKKRVLPRSYRVPEAVHSLAVRLTKQLSFREEKEYAPRFECEIDENGFREYDEKTVAKGIVRQTPHSMLNEFSAPYLIADAEQKIKQGKTVMFLASCSFQLEVLRKALKEAGHTYHNPYRKANGAWNPLSKRTTIDALMSFLAPRMKSRTEMELPAVTESLTTIYTEARTDENFRYLAEASELWSKEELEKWTAATGISRYMKRGVLNPFLDKLRRREMVSGNTIKNLFSSNDAFLKAVCGDLNWFLEVCKTAAEGQARYAAKVLTVRGEEHLRRRPQIVIGTIHSVKGAQADVVYICPDISLQAHQASFYSQDELLRQFYVGITRAFEELVICEPDTNMFFDVFR